MGTLNNFHVWRDRAQRRLPRVAFDFVDGGAEDEVTVRRNRSAFDDLALIPRVLRGVGDVSTETELFGKCLRMPLLLAPAGAWVVGGREAHLAAERAASAAGTISFFSAYDGFESVAYSPPQWLQLYLLYDRDALTETMSYAKGLGISVLVLTVDTPVSGRRDRNIRNQMTIPLRIVTPRIALDAARRPGWLWRYFASGANRRATLRQGLGGRVRNLKTQAEAVRASLNPQHTWEDVQWLRSLWDGPLLLKGVMCGEDAELALKAGCQGVIVSNHGGRQLDGVPASIEVLPEVVAAVSGRAVVLLDSGVRRGTDVVKALSLGANACLVGRPWVFAATSDGAAGVTAMLDEFREEITCAMQLLGARSISELGPEFVRRRPGFGWENIREVEARA
jgi:isopentenyl diphosphate isomerase/L-lactate dehydrogenase-like FMN-dependent dehydrogenase